MLFTEQQKQEWAAIHGIFRQSCDPATLVELAGNWSAAFVATAHQILIRRYHFGLVPMQARAPQGQLLPIYQGRLAGTEGADKSQAVWNAYGPARLNQLAWNWLQTADHAHITNPCNWDQLVWDEIDHCQLPENPPGSAIVSLLLEAATEKYEQTAKPFIVQLNLSETQAKQLAALCDLATAIHLGQWHRLKNIPIVATRIASQTADWQEIEASLAQAQKTATGVSQTAGISLFHPTAPAPAKIAFAIKQAIETASNTIQKPTEAPDWQPGLLEPICAHAFIHEPKNQTASPLQQAVQEQANQTLRSARLAKQLPPQLQHIVATVQIQRKQAVVTTRPLPFSLAIWLTKKHYHAGNNYAGRLLITPNKNGSPDARFVPPRVAAKEHTIIFRILNPETIFTIENGQTRLRAPFAQFIARTSRTTSAAATCFYLKRNILWEIQP